MKLEFIQVLRGIAALMVVFFHFAIFLEPVVPGSVAFFSNGYLGVDIFFVISGFIIYVSTERVASRDGVVFFVRRLCRVVLPAWCAMFLSVLVMPPMLKQLLLGLAFIPLQNSAPPGFGYSFLIVAWTLTYELIFYALFAAILSSTVGRRLRGLCVAAAIVGVVAAVQLSTHVFTLDAQAGPVVGLDVPFLPIQLLSLLGNPILLEFVVGIFFGWAYLAGYFQRCSLLATHLAVILTIFLVLKYQFRPGHGLSCGGLLSAIVVGYVLAIQGWWERVRNVGDIDRSAWKMVVWPAIFIGDISYSLYLIHPSVKALLIKVAGHWGRLGGMANWTFAIALVGTFLLSIFFYRWIELPAQRFGRFAASRSRAARAIAA